MNFFCRNISIIVGKLNPVGLSVRFDEHVTTNFA
jgi:hypothetical protein